MTKIKKTNRQFAETIINRFDPSFKQRWEIYDGILKRLTGKCARWLDGGCGINTAIEEFPCDFTIGVDVYRHRNAFHLRPNHLTLGNMQSLPFRDNEFTIVTMNTVVEHFENPQNVLNEIFRVLRPGGHVLIHTTNVSSPIIFLGNLLPEFFRLKLMTSFFGAQELDVFKTYHELNTLTAFENVKGFDVEEFHAVQDINRSNRILFIILFVYHMGTKIPGLWRLRTNIVVLLRKKSNQ